MKVIDKIKLVMLSAFALTSTSALADEVKGVMLDITNNPLPGYVVVNVNTLEQAVTNKRGEFMIEAQSGDKFDILLNSVVVERVALSDLDNTTFKLSVDPYKTIVGSAAHVAFDRHRTSGAVDVATSDDLENYSAFSSANTIVGKLASLSTVISSGEIDDDYASLYVRGVATTNSSAALVLIDGYESSLSALSNIEIESITVLKDAVALAPYGLRGANGVVLVTTKRGVAGEPQFKVNVEYGVSLPQVDSYVDATTYATLVNQARANDGLSAMYSADELALQGSDPYLYPNVNWADIMLKDVSNYTNASVEMTGGSDKIRYYNMFSYKRYDGVYNYTDLNDNYDLQNTMDRLNFRSNISLDVTKNLQVNARIGGRIDNNVDIEYGTNAYYKLLMATPANRYSVFNEDGSYNGTSYYNVNPYAELVEMGFDEYHERTLDASVDFILDLGFVTKGLSISGAASFNSESIITESFDGGEYTVYDPVTQWGYNDTGEYVATQSYTAFGYDSEISFNSEDAIQDHTNTFRASLNYDRDFGKHQITSTLLAERSEQSYQEWAEDFKYVNYAFSANYGYADKYFADVAVSYSGTQAFESGNNFGCFPAVGATWIVSREDFMKSSEWINFLKLRLSAGIVGNAGSSRFLYLDNYASDGTYYFGETATSVSGLSVLNLMDHDFTWEKGFSYNAGVDMRFFDNKAFLSFDVFSEKRVNILDDYNSIVTSMVVYNNMYDCYAQVLNQGFDFSLGFQDSFNSGFSYKVSANGGLAKNKILRQYELEDAVYSEVGNPIDGIYGYLFDGFYSSENEIQNSTPSSFGDVQVGDIKYKNLNGDDVIDEGDMTYLGSSFPTFNYGVNINLSYRSFYVDAWFDGMAGGYKNVVSNVIYNPLNGTDGNISTYAAENYWTAERAETATLPRLSYDYNYNNSQTSSLFVVRSDFMRLRTAEIGYRLPSSILEKFSLGSAKLYLRAHNLWVLDSMDALDPEVTSGYPLTKSFYVGLNIGF